VLPVRGDLRDSTLADVMRHLYAERKSGILRLSREGIERRVHFKKGVPVFADDGGAPIGSREQAEGLLQELFSWTSGALSFVDGEPAIDETHALSASPSVVILKGCRAISDRRTLEHLVGGVDSVYRCTETSVLPLFTMKLAPEESVILKFARERERFTSKDLPLTSDPGSGSDDLAIVRALNALVSVGLLEIAERGVVVPLPPPAPPESHVLPSEVETLLDTFEAKRSGAAATTPDTSTTANAAANAAANANANANATATAEPEPLPVDEGRREPVLEPPLRATGVAPARRAIRSPSILQVAIVGLAALALAAALGMWVGSRGREAPRSESELGADPPSSPGGAEPRDAPSSGPGPAPSETAESKSETVTETDTETEAAAALDAVEPEPAPDPPSAPVPRTLPTRTPKVAAVAPVPRSVEPDAAPLKPASPDPAALLGEASAALRGGDLETARSKLAELEAHDRSYPGASELRVEIEERSWERKLPLALNVRHDHALGGCNGVLTLTSTGYTYRSKDHEWIWSFTEVAETERRAPNRLRIETLGHSSFNFELRESLSDDDWARHQALGRR
jgi:Domain of unknown function (DUF4388)